jgi:hypothetical protein
MRTTLLLSISLLVSSSAFAQDKTAPAGPPPPAPQLEEAMKPMMGNWKCSGKTHASEMGPEHPISGTMSVKADLQKHWYVLRWDEKKTKQSPVPFSMMGAFGWAGDKLMSAAFDNMGGVTHATSAGWKDNVIVWEGSSQMGPMKMGFRETMTQDKKALSSKVEFQGKDGKWVTGVEYTCKK